MLNKKTVAMAMAVATIAPTVAPIVANAAENVTEIQVSSGETEKIAKINAELEKAKSITFTNDKVVKVIDQENQIIQKYMLNMKKMNMVLMKMCKYIKQKELWKVLKK